MKRRGFLKFLGLAAAAPVVAPLAEKCLRAEQLNHIPESAWETEHRITNEMDAATLSCVSLNALSNPFLLKVGDTVTIGDDPRQLLITKTFRHGEQL